MRKSQDIKDELIALGFAEPNGLFAFGIAIPSGLALGFKDAGLASYMSDKGVGYGVALMGGELVITPVDIYADEKNAAKAEKTEEAMEVLRKRISKSMIEEISYKGTLFSPNLTIKLKDEKKKIICQIEKKYRDEAHKIVESMKE